MSEKKTVLEKIGEYLSLKRYLANQEAVVANVSDSISFKGANLWALVFAILIASLGLNMNSTAVIIGAMLVSPLMAPIIGMGLAVGTNDFELLKNSFKNYLIATVISLITATLYFAITPYHGAQSELLARTSPTLYDVLIALCGGAAGFIALTTNEKGNIIPGVAIATALMPPLCTAGFGIASLSLKYFLGAFYLYFINSVFIALATFFGSRLLQFEKKTLKDRKRYRKAKRSIILIAVLTMVPAAIMTVNIIRESIIKSSIENFVAKEMRFHGAQIISQDVDKENMRITLAAVGREISNEELKKAEESLSNYGLSSYSVKVIQGSISDSLDALRQFSSLNNKNDDLNLTLQHQSAEIEKLKQRLAKYTKYEPLTKKLVGEMQALYPDVSTISVSPAIESGKDTNDIDRYISAVVTISKQTSLSREDHKKMEEFIKKRCEADSVVLIIRH